MPRPPLSDPSRRVERWLKSGDADTLSFATTRHVFSRAFWDEPVHHAGGVRQGKWSPARAGMARDAGREGERPADSAKRTAPRCNGEPFFFLASSDTLEGRNANCTVGVRRPPRWPTRTRFFSAPCADSRFFNGHGDICSHGSRVVGMGAVPWLRRRSDGPGHHYMYGRLHVGRRCHGDGRISAPAHRLGRLCTVSGRERQ